MDNDMAGGFWPVIYLAMKQPGLYRNLPEMLFIIQFIRRIWLLSYYPEFSRLPITSISAGPGQLAGQLYLSASQFMLSAPAVYPRLSVLSPVKFISGTKNIYLHHIALKEFGNIAGSTITVTIVFTLSQHTLTRRHIYCILFHLNMACNLLWLSWIILQHYSTTIRNSGNQYCAGLR